MSLPGITDPFVLLDDNQQKADTVSYLFHSPEKIICARTIDEARDAFDEIDAAVHDGFYVAGWVAYECAAMFEGRILDATPRMPDEPLVWMLVTRSREALSKSDVSIWLSDIGGGEGCMSFGQAGNNIDSYSQAIASVKNYIDAGDVYQVNYTFPRACHYGGSLPAIYSRLRNEQPVEYGAFINTGEHTIMSLSPELFIQRRGNTLTAKPMKGTAARASVDDVLQAHDLSLDEKSRAENLMIVDLIRNDVSRVAKPGSVKVHDLFNVQTLPSLHQMTSTVTAKCLDTLTPSDLFAALFPCGSVTGAPKIRAMEIIADLEQNPRGVYCGAIGHFSPASEKAEIEWCFNVPIRTFVMNSDNADDTSLAFSSTGRLGLGSGIVADSCVESEYQECLLKARFAEQVSETDPFHLIETMRLEHGTIAYLEDHMERLQTSAAVFDFCFDGDEVEKQIKDHARLISKDNAANNISRLRLALSPGGNAGLSSSALKEAPAGETPTVCFAEEAICSDDLFRRHKTTIRTLYNKATIWAQQRGYADVLFLNEDGHLAEGAISNVFVDFGGELFTPPISSGALPGVLRSVLMKNSKQPITEKILTRDDLLHADQVYIGNALRGIRAVNVSQELFI